MKREYKYLRFIYFKNLVRWSVIDYVKNKSFDEEVKCVPMSSFLKVYKNPLKLNSEAIYQQITVKLYGKGVILRGIIKGENIKTKQFYVQKGN